jgi:hypothetical protein
MKTYSAIADRSPQLAWQPKADPTMTDFCLYAGYKARKWIAPKTNPLISLDNGRAKIPRCP